MTKSGLTIFENMETFFSDRWLMFEKYEPPIRLIGEPKYKFALSMIKTSSFTSRVPMKNSTCSLYKLMSVMGDVAE